MSRRELLKLAGAGAVLLGAPALGSGCSGSSDRMNAIVVIMDTLRKDHVGVYGNPWIQTPNLDALAKESLRFSRAYPECMVTIPARRAIHTGVRTFPYDTYAPEIRTQARTPGWLPIPGEQTTLAETLKAEGYSTALVTDTYVQFPFNFDRGFDEYHGIRGQENDEYVDPSTVSSDERERYLPNQEDKTYQYLANTRNRQSEEDYFAPQVFLQARRTLERLHRRSPFFLVVDCFDPHEPWDPPAKYTDLYDPGGYEDREPLATTYGESDYLTDRQLQRMRAVYAGEVTMADRWLGNFLDKVSELGLMDNTALIFLSDHGHLLGEHGYTGKLPYGMWPEMTDIAFFLRDPNGKKANEESQHYASTHDVAPTILSMLGVEPPEQIEGQDLSVLLDGEEPEPRDYFTIGYNLHSWARDERYVMFVRNDRSEEAKLYDVQEDPEQTNNLAEDNPEVVERMFEDYILEDSGGYLLGG